MENMNYVRFENTYRELNECYGTINELDFDKDNLSDKEKQYLEKLVKLCKAISEEFK